MSGPVSLGGTLPEGDGNGLTAIVSDLIHDPRHVHVVIGIVDCAKITTKPDTGEIVPTVRVRRIEVVTDKDRRVARQLINRALDRRTGREALPFDLEQDLRAASGDDEEDGDA
jgi:hypothetical protein